MILRPGPLAPPAGRLVGALAADGRPVHDVGAGLPAGDGAVSLVVSDGPFVFDLAACTRAAAGRPLRALVLSRLGAHPDAKAAALQRLWRLEEHVRGSGLPTLTLRLAPIVGPETPLVRQLAGRPRLPREGRQMLNPVAEADVLRTLAYAFDGRAAWEGWYEVAGPEVWTLAELGRLAVASGAARDGGAWEPPIEELAEHRLAECEPWATHFGIAPTPIRAALARRAA